MFALTVSYLWKREVVKVSAVVVYVWNVDVVWVVCRPLVELRVCGLVKGCL